MTNRRFAILVAVLLLGIGASLFGKLANPLAAAGYTKLARPLEQFPKRFDGWRFERDEPLTEREVEVAGADRYLRRIYVHPDGSAVQLYILYIGNREKGLRSIFHNPTVCMPMSGWDAVGEERRRVLLEDVAKQFEVGLYRFRKSPREATILSFFVIDDEPVVNPRNEPLEIAKQKFRLSGEAGYFVQVQVIPLLTKPGEEQEELAIRFLEESGRFVFLHF